MKPSHFIFIILITGGVSCQKKHDFTSEKSSSVLNTAELGGYNKPGNLLISAVFDECGEWGGHSENIRIYTDSSTVAHAKYVVYTFECDSRSSYHHTQKLKPKLDTTIVLDSQRQKAVVRYVIRLSQAKLTERFPGHSGKLFSVMKFDSTLTIRVYDSSQKNDDSYKQLLHELF